LRQGIAIPHIRAAEPKLTFRKRTNHLCSVTFAKGSLACRDLAKFNHKDSKALKKKSLASFKLGAFESSWFTLPSHEKLKHTGHQKPTSRETRGLSLGDKGLTYFSCFAPDAALAAAAAVCLAWKLTA